MESESIDQSILNYENKIKELEKLENEKNDLYKELGQTNITEENKKLIEDKLAAQNEKINAVTKKGIETVLKLDKANLTPEQKAKVDSLSKKNIPERPLFDIFESYPQLIKDFPLIDFDDAREFDRILQSSPKMEWKDARKIADDLVKKRNLLDEKKDQDENDELEDAIPIEVEPELVKPIPENKENKVLKPELEEKTTKPSLNIPDINSFSKTILSLPKQSISSLESNTCLEILKASEIINSKFPYPSQFPNLTKIKSITLESKSSDETKKKPGDVKKPDDVKTTEEVKKGGKGSKKRSKKIKKNKKNKNKTCKKN
jgi:hypothetical protein